MYIGYSRSYISLYIIHKSDVVLVDAYLTRYDSTINKSFGQMNKINII